MAQLAETITRTSSFHTFITIKLLVDKPLVEGCFKAYAYFRWIDDEVDLHQKTREKRLKFINRQKQIIEQTYLNLPIPHLTPEEKMIVELISTNPNKKSKLGSYIINFFKIIEYDAHRKHHLITQKKLDWYCQTLSQAVTDGIEYFIDSNFTYPSSPGHYQAGIGACLTHMLRDYQADLPEGFTNIPKEYLNKHHIKPTAISSIAFHNWVKRQVNLASQHFLIGKKYINSLPILRGKIAAYWYCARFENILTEIKNDEFNIRPNYQHKKLINYFRMGLVALEVIINHYWNKSWRKI